MFKMFYRNDPLVIKIVDEGVTKHIFEASHRLFITIYSQFVHKTTISNDIGRVK